MIENENEDNMTSNFEQSQVSSKYVDRYANPNSSKNKSRNNSNNDGGLAGNDIEIKTEKTDEDMVSNCFAFSSPRKKRFPVALLKSPFLQDQIA